MSMGAEQDSLHVKIPTEISIIKGQLYRQREREENHSAPTAGQLEIRTTVRTCSEI